ncbi:hypothetical protein [Planctobacterium marinum]|uniref:hypothetical protein n=1 Tax=Planctobacterium marinum TaxID=1631968 RepID=UPI0030C6FCB4
MIQLQFKEPSLFNDVDNRDGALSDYLVHLEMVFDIYPNSINDMPACATAKRYLLAQYQPEEYKFEKLPHSIQMFWPAFEGLCSNTENDILLPLESAKTLKPEFIN